MKREIGYILPTALFLVYAVLSASVEAANITGGIVYTDGHQVIYQDLRSGEERDLVADLSGSGRFIIKAATVSPDGRTLVFFDGANKLWARVLPRGKPYLIEVPVGGKSTRVHRPDGTWYRQSDVTRAPLLLNERFLNRSYEALHNTKITPPPPTLNERFLGGLVVSRQFSAPREPPSYSIVYESLKQAQALKEIPGNSQEHLQRVTSRLPNHILNQYGGRSKLSAYIPTTDTFRAITAITLNAASADHFYFGNPILYPREFPYLHVETRDQRIPTKDTPTGYASFSKGTEGIMARQTFGYEGHYGYQVMAGISVEEAQKCFSIKRDAYFPAFHPQEQWLAVIYQTCSVERS